MARSGKKARMRARSGRPCKSSSSLLDARLGHVFLTLPPTCLRTARDDCGKTYPASWLIVVAASFVGLATQHVK